MLEVGEFGHNIKCVIFFRSNSSLVSVIVHDQIYYKVAVFRLFTRARSEFVFYCLDSLVPQLEFVPKIARSSLCALLKFVYEMSINDKLVMHIDLFWYEFDWSTFGNGYYLAENTCTHNIQQNGNEWDAAYWIFQV